MRFMMLYKPGYESEEPPTQQNMEDMGKFIGELAQEGVLLLTDGLQPSTKGSARVRIDNGKFTVTDGPFTETKELIAGFAIVQVNSVKEAIDVTKRFLKVTGEGESEIRLMHDLSAFDAKGPSLHGGAGNTAEHAGTRR